MDNEPKKETGKGVDLTQIVNILRQTAKVLCNKPRTRIIFGALAQSKEPLTFKEIKELTGITQSSLHHHLQDLCRYYIINKSDDYPAKYSLTEFAKYLTTLPEKWLEASSPRI